MGRSIWIVLPYMTAVAAYAGWRGADLWNGWVIWVLALAPLGLAVYVLAHELHKHRGVKFAFAVSVMPVVACVWIALCGLALAWMIADSTRPITNPAVRAGLGAGVTAVIVGFGILVARRRHAKSEANKSERNPTEQPQ
jgi:dipeptide/tripeptide permease